MNCDADSSIHDWIIEYPESSTVFRRLGIDISCAGKSLQYVCFQLELNIQDVMKQLHEAIQNSCNEGFLGLPQGAIPVTGPPHQFDLLAPGVHKRQEEECLASGEGNQGLRIISG